MSLKTLKEKLLKDPEYRKEYAKRDDTDLAIRSGREVEKLRIHLGLTQAQLADKTKMQQPNIARIESGKQLPSLKTLNKIAQAVGTYLIEPTFANLNDRIESQTEKMVENFFTSPAKNTVDTWLTVVPETFSYPVSNTTAIKDQHPSSYAKAFGFNQTIEN